MSTICVLKTFFSFLFEIRCIEHQYASLDTPEALTYASLSNPNMTCVDADPYLGMFYPCAKL